MKKEYIIPNMTVNRFPDEKILTDSSVTENALRSGALKVNGKTLGESANIFSIEF